MMGLPSSMSVDTNDSGLWSVPWHGGWIQDDWRVTDKLRISLGFRFEWEQGLTERFNRGWAGGFNNTYRYPFSGRGGGGLREEPDSGTGRQRIQSARAPATIWARTGRAP